jgi:hypothetical protein
VAIGLVNGWGWRKVRAERQCAAKLSQVKVQDESACSVGTSANKNRVPKSSKMWVSQRMMLVCLAKAQELTMREKVRT